MSSKPEIIDLTSSTSSSSSSSDGWSTYFPPSAQPWKKHDVGEPSEAPIPADRVYVSPFLFTSDEESSEDEDEDPTFIPPSTPERSQPRPRVEYQSSHKHDGSCD